LFSPLGILFAYTNLRTGEAKRLASHFYRSVRTEAGAQSSLEDILVARLRQEIAKHSFISFIREEREKIVETVSVPSGTRYGYGMSISSFIRPVAMRPAMVPPVTRSLRRKYLPIHHP
jgi:hypothetical protein